MSRISNSSSAVARNNTLAPSTALTRTGVLDFLTATRFFGCAWLRRISSRPLASLVSSSMCLSATAFCVANEVAISELTPFPSLKGELAGVVESFELAIGAAEVPVFGIGAEILGTDTAALFLGCEGAETTGGVAVPVVGVPVAAVAVPGVGVPDDTWPLRASWRRSRRSVSRRPLEG